MTFAEFIRHPSTGAQLDAALADNARVDAEIAAREAQGDGLKPCCVDAGYVAECNGNVDAYRCAICGHTWTARCPDADLWRPES